MQTFLYESNKCLVDRNMLTSAKVAVTSNKVLGTPGIIIFHNYLLNALEGHTLTLLVRFYRKVWFVVLATGVCV